MEDVKQRFGRLDVLVNLAGIVRPAYAEALSTQDIQDQVSINLLGTIYGCRAALQVMKVQGSGRIVNVASLGGIVPMPGEAVYSATKYAVRGYTFSLGAELQGSGIDVCVVCTDSVDTPQLAYELEHDEAIFSFLRRPVHPEAVARKLLQAVLGHKLEILIPASTGGFARMVMAFPSLFFLLTPWLKKIGTRNMEKRRKAMFVR